MKSDDIHVSIYSQFTSQYKILACLVEHIAEYLLTTQISSSTASGTSAATRLF